MQALPIQATLSETPLDDWQQVINLNLTSVFQCILGILPSMEHRGTGTIINIASIAAKQPFPGWGAYSVSKAGLIALSQTLAQEERIMAFASQLFVPVQSIPNFGIQKQSMST